MHLEAFRVSFEVSFPLSFHEFPVLASGSRLRKSLFGRDLKVATEKKNIIIEKSCNMIQRN